MCEYITCEENCFGIFCTLTIIGNGLCNNGVCNCRPGFKGRLCSESTATKEQLEVNNIIIYIYLIFIFSVALVVHLNVE